MKRFVKQHVLVAIGLVLGAIAGYTYYRFAGCASGTCAITASPVNSTIYFSIMGGILFSMFKKNKTKTT